MVNCVDCGKDLYVHATVKYLNAKDVDNLPIYVCSDCCINSYRVYNRYNGVFGEICMDGKRIYFKKFPLWKRFLCWFKIYVLHERVD